MSTCDYCGVRLEHGPREPKVVAVDNWLQPLGVPEYLFLLLLAPLLLAAEEARKLLMRRLREGHSLPNSV